MTGRLSCVLVALAACSSPAALYAQFTDPRTYTLAPVGISQLEVDYIHAEADASIDASIEVAGAHFEQNQAVVSCTHNFSMLSHLAWIKLGVPYATVSGSIAGTSISGSTTGAGDSSLQFTTLLKGGRALSAAEFAAYQPAPTVGLSVTITAPTGEYDAEKLLNLGSHRWSLKPELALSYPFGPDQSWVADAYVNVYFFTDNTAYHGVEVLRQEPLPGIEAHLSHDFTPRLWASLDLRYGFRGETVVDGVNQNDAQESLVAGAEANWSPSPSHSFVFVFAKALVHHNAPSATGVALKYVYTWGAAAR